MRAVLTILVVIHFSVLGCNEATPVSENEPNASQQRSQSVEPPASATTSTPANTPAEPAALSADGDAQLAVGKPAPNFTVELLGGERRSFSSHLQSAKGPTILLFDRAHW